MTTHAHDEDARLAALHSYGVLDGPRPPALDELTRLASSIFDTPMSAVSLVDRDRQWFAGNTGLADAETPLDVSFCARTVADRRQLVVPDARADERFSRYRNVTGDPHIRFYAGSPLVDEDGHALGALCVIDDRPGDIGPRRREALDTLAAQAVGHLSLLRNRMVDHLLTGTRPAHAPTEPHRTPVDLAMVVEAAWRACRALAEQRAVALTAAPSPAQVVVRADVTQLTHAVQQLVRNAVLFTPPGGDVTVSVVAGPAPTVEVADTGVGVPADELPYVFQRFYRGRHARQQAVPGVGLGLHIARQVAAAHGGNVTLSSGVTGTTARLSLAG
jgi:signal transduction histidine kinase